MPWPRSRWSCSLAGVRPGGAHWKGIVWLGARWLFLFVVAATALFGMARSPSMTQLVWGVEAEPNAVADDTPPTPLMCFAVLEP